MTEDSVFADEMVNADHKVVLVGGSRSVASAYRAMLAAATLPAGIPVPPQYLRKTQQAAYCTDADNERLAKAQAKRERKAAQRRVEAR